MNNSDNKSNITIMRFLNGKQVKLNDLIEYANIHLKDNEQLKNVMVGVRYGRDGNKIKVSEYVLTVHKNYAII